MNFISTALAEGLYTPLLLLGLQGTDYCDTVQDLSIIAPAAAPWCVSAQTITSSSTRSRSMAHHAILATACCQETRFLPCRCRRRWL